MPLPRKHDDPRWLQYEKEVAELVTELDTSANVKHNQRVYGMLSGTTRQIDVQATGTVVGQEITVVVECKRRKKPAGIGIIDEFIGKLLDIGADRGVLYSFTGFTEPAWARADSASNPKIGLVALGEPEKEHEGMMHPEALQAASAPDRAAYPPARRRRWITEDYREFLQDEDASLVRFSFPRRER